MFALRIVRVWWSGSLYCTTVVASLDTTVSGNSHSSPTLADDGVQIIFKSSPSLTFTLSLEMDSVKPEGKYKIFQNQTSVAVHT